MEESNSKGSYENYSNSRLQQILLKDKLIPSSESNKVEKKNVATSIVRRIVEVNLCLEHMHSIIVQEYQFDVLDEAIASRHISNERQRNRAKAADGHNL